MTKLLCLANLLRNSAFATTMSQSRSRTSAMYERFGVVYVWFFLYILPLASAKIHHPTVKLFILAGEGNVEGFASIGDLKKLVTTVPKNGGLPPYSHLWNTTTNSWTVRDDVFVSFDHSRTDNWTHGRLTVDGTLGGDIASFGPELQLGHVLGDAYKEPVVIVKAGWKGRSLAKDFAAPQESEAGTGGFQWYRMMMNIQKTASSIHEIIGDPAYKHCRIDIVGFVWWQGYTDFADAKMTKAYADNLKHFVTAVRDELKHPYMPFVIAELGGQGARTKDKNELHFREMQAEMTDKMGNWSVALVPTSTYVKTEPAIKDYTLYYGNARTMLEISQAFAMTLIEMEFQFTQGGNTYGWVFEDADITESRIDSSTEIANIMIIGILGAGIFCFVAIMRYGGNMDRAWNTTFRRLRPDDKDIEMKSHANGMQTPNPMMDDDEYNNDQPRERTLPDIRRSGQRLT